MEMTCTIDDQKVTPAFSIHSTLTHCIRLRHHVCHLISKGGRVGTGEDLIDAGTMPPATVFGVADVARRKLRVHST